jgi:transposase
MTNLGSRLENSKANHHPYIPNKFLANLLAEDPDKLGDIDKLLIAAVVDKYGQSVIELGDVYVAPLTDLAPFQTARAVFTGPSIVFGGITKRYHIDKALQKSFGDDITKDIISLVWYLASEGSALSDSDVWLDRFDNPRGHQISSQDITRLLDRMGTDSILTFYKEWLASVKKTNDRVLYDLTSISWSGKGLDMAGWGHNRDKDKLPQVNYALLCARITGMPLFAWPLDGSISDTRTLQNTLQFLDKLGYNPGCLMMDRGFGSQENITYMLRHGYIFLQALRLNSGWLHEIIDAGRMDRLSPDSVLKVGDRTYYASTTVCQWIVTKKMTKKGAIEENHVIFDNGLKSMKSLSEQISIKVVSQHRCRVHVLFCQDLVGKQWDRFMESLKLEHDRLINDEQSAIGEGFQRYFKIEKKRYSRQRSVEYNLENIEKHRDRYAGHICFITNDKTISTAEQALSEYSTRDYIEKDFDELKNELDMKRIRVHTDGRMCARLLIQFIAQILLREIRVLIQKSDECKKMTRKQIASHIKGIYKIVFKGKYKDVKPELSKSQRDILEALGFRDDR